MREALCVGAPPAAIAKANPQRAACEPRMLERQTAGLRFDEFRVQYSRRVTLITPTHLSPPKKGRGAGFFLLAGEEGREHSDGSRAKIAFRGVRRTCSCTFRKPVPRSTWTASSSNASSATSKPVTLRPSRECAALCVRLRSSLLTARWFCWYRRCSARFCGTASVGHGFTSFENGRPSRPPM